MLGKVQASLTLPSLKRAFQVCVSFPTFFHRSAKGAIIAFGESSMFGIAQASLALHSLKRAFRYAQTIAPFTLHSGRSLSGKEPKPGSHADNMMLHQGSNAAY